MRERERKKETHFKELAHMTMEAGTSDACGAGHQADDQGRNYVVVHPKGILADFLLLAEVSLLFHSGLSLI